MAIAFDTPIITNDQSIDRVLAAGLPVVLVFLNATPSSDLESSMKQLAKKYAGKILLAQIDTRDNPASAQRFSITQPPSLVTVNEGKTLSRAERIQGNDLVAHTEYLLGKGPKPVEKQTGTSRAHYTSTTSSAPHGSSSATSSSGQPIVVNDHNFDQIVMHSSIPVIVDFWAPWCGPCRMTDPILEKIAGEAAGKLIVAKVNVDENPLIASRYGIQSIPTMMVVTNGHIADRWTGALPEPYIRQRLAHYLG